MTRNYRKAFNALKALGCPVFERIDRPGEFLISAEEENSWEWADYYNEFNRFPDFGVNAKVREVLEPLGLHAEWENPACLLVCES